MCLASLFFWIVIAILLYVDRGFFVESSLEYSETAFSESGEIRHIHQTMYAHVCKHHHLTITTGRPLGHLASLGHHLRRARLAVLYVLGQT